jgi:hypothetical protein
MDIRRAMEPKHITHAVIPRQNKRYQQSPSVSLQEAAPLSLKQDPLKSSPLHIEMPPTTPQKQKGTPPQHNTAGVTKRSHDSANSIFVDLLNAFTINGFI